MSLFISKTKKTHDTLSVKSDQSDKTISKQKPWIHLMLSRFQTGYLTSRV